MNADTQPAAGDAPQWIPLEQAGWPLIELGFGLIEVAEGRQPVQREDGTNDERPALIFGRNGSGKVGEPLQSNRKMLPGEPLAVVSFSNVESVDVVIDKLMRIRGAFIAASPQDAASGAVQVQEVALDANRWRHE